MATVLDLVSDSLFEIGVLSAGETADSSDGLASLRTLNRLVNAWKAERVYIYTVTRTTWTIATTDGTYTVGTGGDVNVLRPIHVDSVAFTDSSITPTYETQLHLMTDAEWQGVRIKTQTAEQPHSAYYNLTYPLATLDLWPVPLSATLTGVLYAPQAAAEFTGLAQDVSLPPGYERMIVKNLAVELAPQYGAQVSPQLEKQAQESLAVVLRANKRVENQQFEPAAMMNRRSYDIYTDQT